MVYISALWDHRCLSPIGDMASVKNTGYRTYFRVVLIYIHLFSAIPSILVLSSTKKIALSF